MTDDLKKLAEAAKAADALNHSDADNLHEAIFEAGLTARRQFARAATPAAILNLIRERDEARAEVARLSDGFTAATANRDEAVRRRAAAEATLSAAREEVERLRDYGQTALDTAERILNYLGIGHEASKEPGADRRRDLIASWIDKAIEARLATLTKEPTDV